MLRDLDEAFAATCQARPEISASFRAHFRYPEDLFKVQRDLLTKYHVDTPGEFFSDGDFWDVPDRPAGAAGTAGRSNRRTTCSPGCRARTRRASS